MFGWPNCSTLQETENTKFRKRCKILVSLEVFVCRRLSPAIWDNSLFLFKRSHVCSGWRTNIFDVTFKEMRKQSSRYTMWGVKRQPSDLRETFLDRRILQAQRHLTENLKCFNTLPDQSSSNKSSPKNSRISKGKQLEDCSNEEACFSRTFLRKNLRSLKFCTQNYPPFELKFCFPQNSFRFAFLAKTNMNTLSTG